MEENLNKRLRAMQRQSRGRYKVLKMLTWVKNRGIFYERLRARWGWLRVINNVQAMLSWVGDQGNLVKRLRASCVQLQHCHIVRMMLAWATAQTGPDAKIGEVAMEHSQGIMIALARLGG